MIPATGAVGTHILQVLEGTHPVPYLNQQQAPVYQPLIPTVLKASFRVTQGAPVLPEQPSAQLLPREAGGPAGSSTVPTLTLNYRSGPVGAPLVVHGTGFPASTTLQLSWSTTVGNRLSGSGFSTQTRALANVRTDASGRFAYAMPTPDDVGGTHTLAASATTGSMAAATYTVTPSVFPISPRTVAPGAPILVHLKGVGYTQTANIYTLVMDNNYVGYACGANSQGDVAIHLYAPGIRGIHYVDLYPAIYEGIYSVRTPSRLSTVPTCRTSNSRCSMRFDHPGERLPAFHLTFTVQ